MAVGVLIEAHRAKPGGALTSVVHARVELDHHRLADDEFQEVAGILLLEAHSRDSHAKRKRKRSLFYLVRTDATHMRNFIRSPWSPNLLNQHSGCVMQAAREHFERGELQKAAEEFQRAAAAVEKESDKASCLMNAGACLVSLGSYEKALACLDSAGSLLIAESSDRLPVEEDEATSADGRKVSEVLSDVLHNSAIARRALGKREEAIHNFGRCLELRERSGDVKSSAEVMEALAECHREAGDVDKEISYLEKARGGWQSLGETGREAIACGGLARAHLKAGREADCRQLLSTAKLIGSRAEDRAILGEKASAVIHSPLH